MISHKAIRQGIRQVLLAVNNSDLPDEDNIAWENQDFTPPEIIPWLRETMIPGTERQTATDTIQSVGIMQYDVFWPAGQGTEDAEQLADDIITAFAPHTQIGANALTFRSERLAAVADEKWYIIPIRLTWRAHSIG